MANAMLQQDFQASHHDLLTLSHPTAQGALAVHEPHQQLETRQDSEVGVSTCTNLSLPQSSSHNTLGGASGGVGMGVLVDDTMKRAGAPFYKNTNARKSVEFAILPPPIKRSRPCGTHGNENKSAHQIVQALCVSITPSERLDAVRSACSTFDHNNQALHDDEMANGADAALTKHLTFLMQQQSQQRQEGEGNHDSLVSFSTTSTDEMFLTELALTCDALECLFRASSTAVGIAFKRLGGILLRFLGRLLSDELQRRQTAGLSASLSNQSLSQIDKDGSLETSSISQETSTDSDMLLRKLTKLLGHFARVGEATKALAHYPGLLGNLVNLVAMSPYACIPWEARLSALWTIANLACNPENMQMMACVPGLLPTLVKIANRQLHPSDSLETSMEVLRSRSIASRAILNLSWSPENKILLAGHSWVVDLLIELLVVRSMPTKSLSKSSTVQEILDTTRSHVAGALRNMAAAPRRVKIALCDHQNGRLLDVLTDAALNDHDGRVKDRAFATIHNLAVQDTAQTMLRHPALVLAIKDVLLSTNDDTEHEHHRDGSPREHASATLLVLERSIQPSMDSYENLLDLLESLHPTTPGGDPTTNSMRTSATDECMVQMEAV